MIETILLALSIIANVLFVFYARWLINIVRVKEEDVTNLSIVVSEYVSHVKAVHEMEVFYGDPTLSALIVHGTDLVEKIEDFDYLLLEREEEEEAEEPLRFGREQQ